MSDNIDFIKSTLQDTTFEEEIQQDVNLEISIADQMFQVENQVETIIDMLVVKNIITEQEYNFAFANVIEYTPDNLKNEKDFNEFLTKRRLNLIQILKRAGLE